MSVPTIEIPVRDSRHMEQFGEDKFNRRIEIGASTHIIVHCDAKTGETGATSILVVQTRVIHHITFFRRLKCTRVGVNLSARLACAKVHVPSRGSKIRASAKHVSQNQSLAFPT